MADEASPTRLLNATNQQQQQTFNPAVACYSLANNSYATRLANNNNNNIAVVENNQCDQEQDGSTKTKQKTATIDCFVTYLFGANLILSILNTLLLSSIIKSILPLEEIDHQQLGGFLRQGNDKFISWSDQLEQVEFNLPVNLALRRSSIQARTIRSHEDGPLMIERGHTAAAASWPSNSDKRTDRDGKQVEEEEGENVINYGDKSLLIGSVESELSDDENGQTTRTSLAGKSSFILINGENNHMNAIDANELEPVEIVTKSLALSLINNNINGKQAKVRNSKLIENNHHYHETQSQSGPSSSSFNLNLSNNSKRQNHRLMHKQPADNSINNINGQIQSDNLALKQQEQQHRTTRRLLDFDGEQQAITFYLLPNQQLNNLLGQPNNKRPATAGSSPAGKFLTVSEQVQSSSQSIGTIEDNLDIQTRQGNLACKSGGGESLKLVSKLGKLRLVSSEQLTFQSATINLNATNQLFIFNGLEYLDAAGDEQGGRNNKQTTTAKGRQTRGDGSGATTGQLDEQPGQEAGMPPPNDDSNLKAYNLILVDGKLMAD